MLLWRVHLAMFQISSKIQATFKSKDTEELLDRLFYRPFGYLMAIGSKKVGFTPNVITIASIFFGVAAGHLFYYNNITINLIGVLLLVLAEAMDSADGQLARMTNIHSRYGKILDGFAGNLMFTSIYLHLCARFILNDGTPWILLIALISGISHSYQSAMSEYYRNFYIYFVYGDGIAIIDEAKDMKEKYKNYSWLKSFGKKFLLRVYINYTLQQESLSKSIRKLYKSVQEEYKRQLPNWLMQEYKKLNKPLLKYGNILTTNTRMIVLFITIFYADVLYYFLFELIILNLLLVYFVLKHEKTSKQLIEYTNKHTEAA